MVFQKKGGAATKRSFSQMKEKIPKKDVFEAEEEDDDDDDLEDDSDLDDSDSDDASDSGDAISKVNAKGKQTPIQGKSPFLQSAKGQIQSPGLFSGKKQLVGPHQKLSMQGKKELFGNKNEGKGKMMEREAVEADDSEDDDDDDDTEDDDSDSGDAGGKVNAKGKQTPQGKGSSLVKTPKGQAQTPVLSSGKKNQAVTPSPKQAKQNTMKEFPGMKGSAKKTLVKEAEEEDDDDDDDDDDEEDDNDEDESDDEAPKTPSTLNKSAVKKEPNGKKDMHVSFELPQKGGAAVAKKSQQNTSVQAKKNQQAATPAAQQGKAAKQAGKMTPGKETPKGKKKPASDDDDDDDDESDEEDEDMEEDDSDDDDDDDDDEDDDDEEEQEAIKKKVASLKKEVLSKKEKKAQIEQNSKSPEPKNKKGKTLLQNQSADSKVESKANNTMQNKAFQESMNIEAQRKRERDARNLFIRGLPADVTTDEIKALSPDILEVNLPNSQRQKRKGQKALYGFLVFASEKKAEENYVKLQKKKIRGQELFIDYSGEKSKNSKIASAPQNMKNINKKKLYVSALPADVTIGEVAQLFPRSCCITLNNAPEYRNSSVAFHTEEDAAEALKANENPKIRGRAITVLYAIEGSGKSRKFNKGFKRPFEGKQNFQPKKKMRM